MQTNAAIPMRYSLVILLAYGIGLTMAAAVTVMVGHFSAGDLRAWQSKSFSGKTRYTLVEQHGRHVLQSDSQGTASGLYREMTVDLNRTPYLNWSWRVADILERVNERSKQGDDFPARVYVVISGGMFFWHTRSVIYVWSNNQPPGTIWKNPYTDNARVIALRSGKQAGWFTEKRNVRADFQRLFGDTIEQIDAVAIMTDTDNSGQAATAWYGDIYFSAQ